MPVKVIGAGLAGSEAAWQIAQAGVQAELVECKPLEMPPAHHSPDFAELVCSNSLRAAAMENAVGLLKEEMRLLGSLIMECADATSVPAGGALAVDRAAFSALVTEKIRAHPNISVVTARLDCIPDCRPCVIATGPLTLPALAADIADRFGGALSFFDAAAPIVTYESIDMNTAYFASRYGKGTPDYINCPMTREEYLRFRDALCGAQCVQQRDFEPDMVFEGCMPIEVMAARGEDTMRFGPLKPVGLEHPVTGARPYAVVQLRRDNAAGSLYNMVGFQTHLTFPEQRRVFSMIPGLENAAFARYGVMHRNSFIHSPGILSPAYEVLAEHGLFFAGQITGVEGYVESAASGLVAGVNAARRALNLELLDFPASTATGALAHYISNRAIEDFQPMNINFGLIEYTGGKARGKRERRERTAQAALNAARALRQEMQTAGVREEGEQ